MSIFASYAAGNDMECAVINRTMAEQKETFRDDTINAVITDKYRKILQLFRNSQKESNVVTFTKKKRKKRSSADERKERFKKNMEESWLDLPNTLKRKKEKISQELLSEYHSAEGSGTDEDASPKTKTDMFGFSSIRTYTLYKQDCAPEPCKYFRKIPDESVEENDDSDALENGCELLRFSKLEEDLKPKLESCGSYVTQSIVFETVKNKDEKPDSPDSLLTDDSPVSSIVSDAGQSDDSGADVSYAVPSKPFKEVLSTFENLQKPREELRKISDLIAEGTSTQGLFVNEDFEVNPEIGPRLDEIYETVDGATTKPVGEGKPSKLTEEEKAKKKSAEAIAKELSSQVFCKKKAEEKVLETEQERKSEEEKNEEEEEGEKDEQGEDTDDWKKAITKKAMETIAEEPEADAAAKLTVREILRRFEDIGTKRLSENLFMSDEERTTTLKQIQLTLRCLEEKVKSFESKSEETHQSENARVADKSAGGWTGKGPASRSQQPPGRFAESEEENAPTAVHDGKHSLLQFAIHHFRQSPEKFEMLKTSDGSISGSLKVIEGKKKNKEKGKGGGKDASEWTWKEQVDLVKFTAKPIEQSLLRLETSELNDLAVECFVCLMRYMGDLPMPTDVSEVKCVYTVLMHCHKFEQLRDEVYCQLMKQTTNNKSVQQESCQRGWRLFSIVAAYFICSDTLKPFLFKYLETAAYDKRRAYHGTATVCLQNLRKTFKYGGRKNVPSVEEITAISAGRNSKRQIYRLPGGTEKVVNTKSTTVVQDVIEELCVMINVTNPLEMEEFSVYCIVEGDTFTMPLAREEYILDVTTELQKNHQVFYLIFCRSVWSYPLRLDSQLYVEVVFNQIAPDYLEGLLLVMPGESLEQEFIYDIAKIAALLHRAADMSHVPTMKETKFLLPKPALSVRDVKPSQWVNMVQSNWQECENMTANQAKAQFLDVLSKWPLFGSSFFAVKKASEPKERTDHILALNRNGVHFLDLATHETLLHYPFSEVISTRKVKSEDGILFLDMKCGNLMQQRITRLQTDQAHEISRLIRQYITMQQRMTANHVQGP